MNGKVRFAVWLCHLSWLVAIVVLILTGLRISDSRVDCPFHSLGSILPSGDVHHWHYISAVVLAISTIFYCLHLVSNRSWQRLKLPHKWWQLKSGWFLLTHWLGICLILANTILGSILLFNPQADVIELHQIVAWLLVAYIAIHLLLALLANGLTGTLRVFLPALRKYQLHLLGIAVALTAVAIYLESEPETLLLEKHLDKVELDGEARETVWQNMTAHTVHTRHGSQAQPIPVEVKGFHDGEYGYFLFQWPDATRSLKHLPLQKTNEGWKVIQTAAKTADENEYYEDKFAVMLSSTDRFAGGGTIHLGNKPLDNHPASAGGRGLHYTNDGSYTHLWHWKAVRTGLSLGQADDNYFGPPSPSDSEYKRYTGGYQKDPDCEHLVRFDGTDFQTKPECGGFVMNWKEYSDGIVQPKRLPANKSFLKKMGTVDLSSEKSDFGRWWMNWDETQAYSPDADSYPVGTIIPSVLSLGPFSQGRGDVLTGASWRNGSWTLEVKRKLEVDNRYDLAITDNTFLWVAAFDHSQTRHSYSLRPLKLVLR